MNLTNSIKLLFIRLYAKSISDISLRRRFKRKYYNRIVNTEIKQKMAKYKFSVSYSVFDGEELLEPSIKAIRNDVDYINVVFQTVSWTGNSRNDSLYVFLNNLKNKGLIDELIEFKPNFKKSPAKNEVKKRNLGLKYAKKAKCHYFMTMDTDEFYFKDAFLKAKMEIINNNITHSYCPIINYGLKPTERYLEASNYAVPFFSKIKQISKLKQNKYSIVLADPTRQLSHFWGAKYYFLCNIQMHHMTYVRNNLQLKLNNSSNGDVRKIPIDMINVKNTIIATPDTFNIEPYLIK